MKLTIVWSLQARNQYIASLAHISTDDPQTAALVDKRVGKSLQLLSEFPDMGLPAPAAGVRTYPVPKTGHSFDYRRVRDQIRIQRWYRQRQIPIIDQGAN